MEDDLPVQFEFKFKIIDYKPCNPRNFIESYYGPILQKYLVGWNPDEQYNVAPSMLMLDKDMIK